VFVEVARLPERWQKVVDQDGQYILDCQKKTFKNNNFVYSSAFDDSDENNNTVSENQQMNEKIKTFPTPPPLPK
jgi:hypothetical protein